MGQNPQAGGGAQPKKGAGKKQDQFSVHIVRLTVSGLQRTMVACVLKGNKPLDQSEVMRVRFELDRTPQDTVDTDDKSEVSYTFSIPPDKEEVTLSAVLLAAREPRADQVVELRGITGTKWELAPDIKAKLTAAYGQLQQETTGTSLWLDAFGDWVANLHPEDRNEVLKSLGAAEIPFIVQALNMIGDPFKRYVADDIDRTKLAVSMGLMPGLGTDHLKKYRVIIQALEQDPQGGQGVTDTIHQWTGNLPVHQSNEFKKRTARTTQADAVQMLISISQRSTEDEMTTTAKGLGLII